MRATEEIESGDGRKFRLRVLDPGDMLDLIEAAGSASGSGAWLQYAQWLCSVSEIDGKPVNMPITKQAMRERGKLLGNVGLQAVVAALNAMEPGDAGDAEASGPDDAAKN